MCQYVGYLTENYLVIKPDHCPSNIYFYHHKSHVSLLPFILCLLTAEDNNQILDPSKLKLLIFLDIAVAVSMGY